MRGLFVVASACMLAACGSGAVGDGERPVQFYLNTPTGGNSFGLSECSAGAVQAMLVFDGQSGRQTGDYSTRATWTSDAPDVVDVNHGQLLARTPGTANITAKYLDFTATASVVVVPIQALYVTPNLTDGSGNPVKDGSGACVAQVPAHQATRAARPAGIMVATR